MTMRRRDFLASVSGAVVAWPITGHAQQSPVPVIGYLSARSQQESARHLAAFWRGLNEAGYAEGRNVAIQYRWDEGRYDRLPTLASDLVSRRVDVIAAIADPTPRTAVEATRTIPIVFAANGDPIRDGLVTNLGRPDGNATGITIFGPAAATKRLQLLHDLVPQAAVMGYLMNPANPNAGHETDVVLAAARSFGKRVLVLSAGGEHEFDRAFAVMEQERVAALLVASDPFFVTRRDQVVSLVARRSIPAIYYLREFAEAGGLMAYGNRLEEVYHLVGSYVARILKSEKPAELPVQQSTKFELVVNLKTAKALGLALPNALLASADEIIE